jgi:iron complex outermembrane receptor protein
MKASISLLLASAAILSVPTAVMAQTSPAPAADADESSEAIVVTARRTEERLQDVPISITVFNQQQLSNRNIVNSGDLVSYTPSLSANNRYGAENASFAIRGFVQDQNTSPSVGVYFADVVAPRANGGTTNGNGAGPGAFFDLQNVQILKGPQGTLFGRNTTGGAILLVPQKPTDKLEGYVEATVGDYNLIRTQGVINLPLSDTVRVRLGADRQQRDGYLHNLPNGQPGAIRIGPKDFGDVNYYALRGSIDIDLTPDIENYTVVNYSDSNTNGNLPKVFCVIGNVTGGASNVCNDPRTPNFTPTGYRAANYTAQVLATPGFYDVSNGNPDANQRIKQWQAINTTTWKASDTLTIKNIISYAQFRERVDQSIYGDNGYDPTTGAINYSTVVMAVPGSQNSAEATFTEELQIQGQAADSKLTYQVGGYFEKSTPLGGFQESYSPAFVACTNVDAFQCLDARGIATSNGAGGNLQGRVGSISISRSQYRFNNKGLYAQATYKILDNLSVTGGFRYTWDKVDGLGQSIKINFPAPNTPSYSCSQPIGAVTGGTSAQVLADPTLCNFARSSKSSRPTWLVDLEYKPTDDIMLYGKYARGYRQGSVNVASYGLETWNPEKVDTYEIGAKTAWHGFIDGTVNVAAFYNNFTNQQVLAGIVACTAISLPQCPFIPASAAGIANAGKSTIQGLEVETSLNLFEGFRVDAGYTYLDTKLKSLVAPAVPLGFSTLVLPPVGGPLSLTPKNQYTITGTYTLPLDPSVGRLSLGLTFSHRDSSFGTTSSRLAQQTLPAQNLLNFNLNWNNVAEMPLDLSFFVTNLTNNKFYLATTGASFGFDSYIANQPRMLGIRAKLRFGD